jgi:hypothetical protein
MVKTFLKVWKEARLHKGAFAWKEQQRIPSEQTFRGNYIPTTDYSMIGICYMLYSPERARPTSRICPAPPSRSDSFGWTIEQWWRRSKGELSMMTLFRIYPWVAMWLSLLSLSILLRSSTLAVDTMLHRHIDICKPFASLFFLPWGCTFMQWLLHWLY